MRSRSGPRVAIASVGIGRIQRGFERAFNDIFEVVREKIDITLYKGGGPQGSAERVPPYLAPLMRLCGLLPLGPVAGGAEYTTYKNECLAFAIALVPDLLRRRFDLIHVVDYPLAIALLRLQKILRLRAKLIFTDGGLMPPRYYPKAHHIHHVAKVQFDRALAFGVPAARMTLVPCGLRAARFAPIPDRRELRKAYGIGPDTFVILAISAVNRAHKRVDHLIREASGLEGNIVLWVDGRLEEPALAEMGREKLGSRFRITHVPSAEVPDLYRLADVFVHGALEEGFGLAVVEAAVAGLPLLIHDSPHFEWLVGNRECLVDMSEPGGLANRLRELMTSRAMPPKSLAASVRERFDWGELAGQYVEMYRRVAVSDPPRGEGLGLS